VGKRPLSAVIRDKRLGSRTGAFGLPSRPLPSLVSGIEKVLKDIRHEQCLSAYDAVRGYPLKRLRNSLIDAMCLNTATQPVAASRTLTEVKGRKATKVTYNPIWDLAPDGAYLKARKFCGLITQICLFYNGRANVLHDLERLAINIWRMSKRHFKGLVKSIRAKLAKAVELPSPGTKPEARTRSQALIRNPLQVLQRAYRRTRRRLDWTHRSGCAVKQLSSKLELVKESLRCTKCTEALSARGLSTRG
jgi:hypothetical protein